MLFSRLGYSVCNSDSLLHSWENRHPMDLPSYTCVCKRERERECVYVGMYVHVLGTFFPLLFPVEEEGTVCEGFIRRDM